MKSIRLRILSCVLALILSLGLAGQVLALPLREPDDPVITTPLGPDISGDFTDPNFRQVVWEWLGRTGTPGYFTQKNIDDQIAAGNVKLNCAEKNISSLNGIEHFNGLKVLMCFGNGLTSLPALPASLEELYCGSNNLSGLPTLPGSLKKLYCEKNQLTRINSLPADLRVLYCPENKIISLPALPATLTDLIISSNPITTLPSLPPTLHQLYCPYTNLVNLPDLPGSLDWLVCEYNYIDVFSDPLYSALRWAVMTTKSYKPQYRIKYVGDDVTLDIGAAKQLGAADIKKQMSSDGAIWGDVENVPAAALTFSSSNNAVAKVDSAGMITGVGEGSCVISAIINGVDSKFTKTTINVNVTNKTASGSGGTTPGTGSGVDYMSASSWAIPELEEAEQYGLFTDEVKDQLTKDITRSEFSGIAVKLYEALTGRTALPAAVNPFTDTNDPTILKAYALDIIRGTTPTTFAPNNKITRQEMCVMIFRALKAAIPSLNTSTSGVGTFADEDKIADWAINEVRFAVKNGIMYGTGGNHMNPLDYTQRQVAVILIKRTYKSFK